MTQSQRKPKVFWNAQEKHLLADYLLAAGIPASDPKFFREVQHAQAHLLPPTRHRGVDNNHNVRDLREIVRIGTLAALAAKEGRA